MTPSPRASLLVINDAGLTGGGAENRLFHLLKHWCAVGRWESITLLSHGDAPAPPASGLPGLRHITARNGVQALAQLDALPSKPSLAQVHNIPRLGTELFNSFKDRGIPVAWFIHDFWPICGRNLLHDRWGHRCEGPEVVKCARCIGLRTSFKLRGRRDHFRAVDLAIPQTQAVGQDLARHGISPRRWMPLTPWIDLSVFQAPACANPNPATVVFAGPLSKAKGADLALHAFATILKKVPGARLRMIGGEPQHGTWAAELAEKLGISHSVTWESRMTAEQLALAFRQSTVTLFCSVGQEPFGLTWAQSMASGCPPVLVKTKSIVECLATADGMLQALQCEATAQSIASVAMPLLTDTTLWARTREVGVQFASLRFNLASASAALEEAYDRLLQGGPT